MHTWGHSDLCWLSVLVGFDNVGRSQEASFACARCGGISQGIDFPKGRCRACSKSRPKKFSFTFRKPAFQKSLQLLEFQAQLFKKPTKQGTSRSLDIYSGICLKGVKLFKTIPRKSSAEIVAPITCLPFQQSAFLKRKLMDTCRAADGLHNAPSYSSDCLHHLFLAINVLQTSCNTVVSCLMPALSMLLHLVESCLQETCMKNLRA